MAKTSPTLTIRRLDERVKHKLRLRAAAHGRSMEDEVRSILGAELAGAEAAAMRASAAIKVEAEPFAARPYAPGLDGTLIVLVIAGGVAAYKSLDLIRRLRERGAVVDAVMTAAAREFVTALSVGALTGRKVFTDLFDRADEHDIGHIRLARNAAAIVVAPATADLMARMATGRADDLATAILLATEAPVLLAPAMNPKMWTHAATRRNVATLRDDGIRFIGPNAGEMAESGGAGWGRMAEPLEIVAALEALLAPEPGPLTGRKAIVTSGPTHEPLDPVRYLANRSSGRQGHAIAAALRVAGAEVTLVSGPVAIPDPPGVAVVHVETARAMLDAVMAALPADVAVMAAAVGDWRAASPAAGKIKKGNNGLPPALSLTENPDILATVARHKTLRPQLVVGFAAETDDLMKNAAKKLKAKGADWIVANDVSVAGGVMGGADNTVHIVGAADGRGVARVEHWPTLSKEEVAARIVARIASTLGNLPTASASGDNDSRPVRLASARRRTGAAVGKDA
jgi:phosphopantothenoylcysteine decarboxylase / phosphopantothenate---cysteine ligase